MERERHTRIASGTIRLVFCALLLVLSPVVRSDTPLAVSSGATVSTAESGGLSAVAGEAIGCTTDADCVDRDPCTDDMCLGGECAFIPIFGCVACEPTLVCPPMDVVFIMDTSGSMKDEAAALCAGLNSIVAQLEALGAAVNPAILGITETPGGLFSCLEDDVVSLLGGSVPGDPGQCPFPDELSAFESWGPATAIVAERYAWRTDVRRVIVPISDEGPCNGSRPDGCNDPGNDRDSITNAIAVAGANGVIVMPVTGTGSDSCVNTLAADLASGTGGVSFNSQDAGTDLVDAIVEMLSGECDLDYGCDDENACTVDDTCVDGVCVGIWIPGCLPCTADGFCNDGNACTDDVCDPQFNCISTPNYDESVSCCRPDDGQLTEIDDQDVCTDDLCDPETGDVIHEPLSNVPCDDGFYCTDGDVCIAGQCAPGAPLDCSDFDGLCLAGVCDEASQSCVAEPSDDGLACDDGDACTENDVCGAGECSGSTLDCDDGDVCTTDVCFAGVGCFHFDNNELCDDGDMCTTDDRCFGGACTPGTPLNCDDQDACTDDLCYPGAGCYHEYNTDSCEDGDACTEGDVCLEGICISGDLPDCDDDNICTDDSCAPATGCVNTPNSASCDDGNICTVDDLCLNSRCNGGVPLDCNDENECTDDFCDQSIGCDHRFNEGPCDDGDLCTIGDTCDAAGSCIGDPLEEDLSCTTDEDCLGALCNQITGTCVCQDEPELCLELAVTLDGTCIDADSELVINVVLKPSVTLISGGQFYFNYDVDGLEFISITPGAVNYPASPFSVPLGSPVVDDVRGTIFYAVSIDPFNGTPTFGPAVMATMRFRVKEYCATLDSMCFMDDNPRHSGLIDASGAFVPYRLCCLEGLMTSGEAPVLNCPESVGVNADAGNVTSIVTWDPVSSTGGCGGSPALVCTGINQHGANMDAAALTGGLMPAGRTQFECTVTDDCGNTDTCSWTVDVSPATTIRIEVHLSPTVADGPLNRCIEFEFYSNCIELPTLFETTLQFGLPFNFPGNAKNVVFKVPAGQYACVSARDPLHTLRSVAYFDIVDRQYTAVFKGDPFFGGNWLMGGNLNGDRVIDILDFGIYASQFLQTMDPDTPCGWTERHADINGDGIVDALDLAFIERYQSSHDKDTCCPGSTSTSSQPALSEITIQELEAMGLGSLRSADLNGDGVLDGQDMTAAMRGVRPTRKSSRGLGRLRR